MRDLKIYFAGSIRAGRQDVGVYEDLIGFLKNYGKVLTEHVGSRALSEGGETNISKKEIHDRDMVFINQSDVMVAEVTTPSLGVGYEIAMARQRKIPIFCLFRENENHSLSAMIEGSDGIDVQYYQNIEEVKKNIADYIKNNFSD